MNGEAFKGCLDTAATHIGYHSATTKTHGTDSQLKQHRGHEISDAHREYLSNSPASPKADPHNKGILKLGLEVQGPHTHNHHY